MMITSQFPTDNFVYFNFLLYQIWRCKKTTMVSASVIDAIWASFYSDA